MSTGEQPLVSVITVTYNSGPYVRDAIDSVLAQNYQNIEYIISDDRSTDDTWNIIQSYSDPRIKAYRNEVNLREYPNRNKSIGLASGKYLIFIDGDDVLYPHGIRFFVDMMESFPTAALAIQKNYIGNILFPALLHPEESLDNYFFGRTNLLSSSLASNFFRTSLLQELKLKENFSTSDDEIRLRIAAREDILLIAGWVSWPRETPNQASARISRESAYLEHLDYTTELLKNFSPDGRSDDMGLKFRGEFTRKACRAAMGYLRAGHIGKALLIMNKLNLTWGDIIKGCLRPAARQETLSRFTSSRPFKRGFLQEKFRQ